MNYTFICIVVFIGIVATTLIDTIGSVLSRRWEFNYTSLAPLSFITYTLVAYYVAQVADLGFVLVATFFVCFYDSIVGWEISLMLKANMGAKTDSFKMSTLGKIFIALLLALIFGVLGNCFGSRN